MPPTDKHMKTKSWLILLVCIALTGMANTGCEEECNVHRVSVSHPTNQVNRFVITSIGYAHVGPVSDKRSEELFIITDTVTKQETLGMTGCSLVHIKKSREETADAIGDIAESIADIAFDE